MNTPSRFLKFTAACGFLSIITTLGIHLFFPPVPADFEARAMLFRNSLYLFNRWWVIFHCLLVLVAMWGFYLVQRDKKQEWAGLGFLFFTVFAIVEIFRQLMVLFYLNGLRANYLAEEEMTLKALLKNDINHFSLLSNSFFGLFILAFGLGNLCYGLSLWSEKRFGKILSWLLILWSMGSMLALSNEFLKSELLAKGIEAYNYIYQPVMRALLAWWVWGKADKLK